ncbi:hypothetical protein CANCADRAFT_46244 [Tortispora caseinolytica NRRL Y-17796]|uniref:Uncharacterized protein n=1 Tax=Tortispora caseinolytica NRRL Y-17796 TaxID=767744 RepID=A0A1E4T9E8_9ASCO|nr:hypothetical protein CANCADRAFT_46244 [Tortispora caseinolytica NRRL Y-17796]
MATPDSLEQTQTNSENNNESGQTSQINEGVTRASGFEQPEMSSTADLGSITNLREEEVGPSTSGVGSSNSGGSLTISSDNEILSPEPTAGSTVDSSNLGGGSSTISEDVSVGSSESASSTIDGSIARSMTDDEIIPVNTGIVGGGGEGGGEDVIVVGGDPDTPQIGGDPNTPIGVDPDTPQIGGDPNTPIGVNPDTPQIGGDPNTPIGVNPDTPQIGVDPDAQQIDDNQATISVSGVETEFHAQTTVII